MRVVGIRELKARLSEYLREVRRGEVILVTDRDEVVAELRRPTVGTAPPVDGVEAALRNLAEAGKVERPALPKGDWSWQPKGAALAAGTAMRVLDELREDRV